MSRLDFFTAIQEECQESIAPHFLIPVGKNQCSRYVTERIGDALFVEDRLTDTFFKIEASETAEKEWEDLNGRNSPLNREWGYNYKK